MMTKQITITDDDLAILDRILTVVSQKQVIRKANFMNIKTGKSINACFEYENFMFEKFGIFLKDNHLSEENKKILEKAYQKKKEKERE